MKIRVSCCCHDWEFDTNEIPLQYTEIEVDACHKKVIGKDVHGGTQIFLIRDKNQ